MVDKRLEMQTREEMDQESETQENKKISHSIDEILRKPICVRRETRVLRNWSVIKENNQVSSQHSHTGKILSLNLKRVRFRMQSHKCMPIHF